MEDRVAKRLSQCDFEVVESGTNEAGFRRRCAQPCAGGGCIGGVGRYFKLILDVFHVWCTLYAPRGCDARLRSERVAIVPTPNSLTARVETHALTKRKPLAV